MSIVLALKQRYQIIQNNGTDVLHIYIIYMYVLKISNKWTDFHEKYVLIIQEGLFERTLHSKVTINLGVTSKSLQ